MISNGGQIMSRSVGGGFAASDSRLYEQPVAQRTHFDRYSVNPYAPQNQPQDGRYGPNSLNGGVGKKTGIFLHLANAALLISGAGGDPLQAVGGLSDMYSNYKERRRSRREVDEAQFQCAECGGMYNSYEEAVRHRERDHGSAHGENGGRAEVSVPPNRPSFECATCRAVFSDFRDAVHHADTAHGMLPSNGPRPGQQHSGMPNNFAPAVESRPSYRCSTCSMEFGTYDETVARARTHVSPQARVPSQHYPPQQAPPFSGASVPSSHYSQPGRHAPHHPVYKTQPNGYGAHQPPPQFQQYRDPAQGIPQVPTTVRSHTRRITHPDGSITVTEEKIRSDGSKTTRTTRYPASSNSQVPSTPKLQQCYSQSAPQMVQTAQPKPGPPTVQAHPSGEYEDLPLAEVSYAEPKSNGKPFY